MAPSWLCRSVSILVIAGFLVTEAQADDSKAVRLNEQIAAELAAAPLPQVDVAAMANPGYAAEFTKRRDDVRRKRAALVLQLYQAAPAATALSLLSERWQTLAQAGEVARAVSEMNAYLNGGAGTRAGAGTDADAKDKEEAAYERAQLIIRQQAGDTPARLAAVEEFRKFVLPAHAGTMIPQLLYRVGRLASDEQERSRLLSQVVREFPDSPAAKVVRGATRRQQAVGKTMEMAFHDAITGTPIDIADFRGKVVVVDFWAAWCTDCAAQVPRMKKVYADFKDKGVEFVGVSLDLPEAEGGLAALKEAVARHQLKWPQYYLGKEWDSDFSSNWGVYSVPAVYVLDGQGKVVSADAGGKLESILTDVLKAARP